MNRYIFNLLHIIQIHILQIERKDKYTLSKVLLHNLTAIYIQQSPNKQDSYKKN